MNEHHSARLSKKGKWILAIAAVIALCFTVAFVAILSSIDLNRVKALLAEAVKRETGRNLDIRGAIDFQFGLRPSILLENVCFENASWASTREMLNIKRLEATVAMIPFLYGRIQINRLVVSEPTVSLERNSSGKWNFEFETHQASGREADSKGGFTLPRMILHEIRIMKGQVSWRIGPTEERQRLSVERFTMTSEGMDKEIALAFKGSYGDKPVEAQGMVGSLLVLRDPGKAYPIDLNVRTPGMEIKAKGTIREPFRFKGIDFMIRAEASSLLEALKPLGLKVPGELGPLRAAARISDEGIDGYKLSDLKISSGAGSGEGDLTLGLGSVRPALRGTLALQKLDVKKILAEAKAGQNESNPRVRKKRIFPNQPLPLEILNTMDARVKIDARQVEAPGFTLTDLSIEGSLEDGNLALSILQCHLAGGDAEGRLEVESRGKAASATVFLKLEHVDMGLLSPSDVKAEGKWDVELDLLGRGSSIAELMAGLNGRTVAVMGRGRVNKNLRIFGGDLAGGILRMVSPSAKTADDTEINCAVSGFGIRKGIATVTALVVDTPEMTVIGGGRVNLRDETLDLSLKPYPKKGTAGLSLSLGELAKPFKLGGTLADPRLEIDAAQTMIAAGKAAGGVLLFGPAGIAAALATPSSREGNPCVAAIEAAGKGLKPLEPGKEEEKPKPEKGVTGKLKSVGKGIKRLFKVQ